MEQLGLKDSSRDLQVNCVISYLFLSIFNVPCICRKIRCDGESCKVLGFWVYLNKAIVKLPHVRGGSGSPSDIETHMSDQVNMDEYIESTMSYGKNKWGHG